MEKRFPPPNISIEFHIYPHRVSRTRCTRRPTIGYSWPNGQQSLSTNVSDNWPSCQNPIVTLVNDSYLIKNDIFSNKKKHSNVINSLKIASVLVNCLITQDNGTGLHSASVCYWDETNDGRILKYFLTDCMSWSVIWLAELNCHLHWCACVSVRWLAEIVCIFVLIWSVPCYY